MQSTEALLPKILENGYPYYCQCLQRIKDQKLPLTPEHMAELVRRVAQRTALKLARDDQEYLHILLPNAPALGEPVMLEDVGKEGKLLATRVMTYRESQWVEFTVEYPPTGDEPNVVMARFELLPDDKQEENVVRFDRQAPSMSRKINESHLEDVEIKRSPPVPHPARTPRT